MGKLSCCGFGHRVMLIDVEKQLREIVERLVSERGVTKFYTGGMGEFDELFSRTVRSMKRSNPDLRLILVIPYLTKELTANKAWYKTQYDEIRIPAELDGVHLKAAIGARNRWMADQSEVVIAALHRNHGGAAEAVWYAKAAAKEVLHL